MQYKHVFPYILVIFRSKVNTSLLSSRNKFHLNFLVWLVNEVSLESHRLMVVLQLVGLEDLDGDDQHL